MANYRRGVNQRLAAQSAQPRPGTEEEPSALAALLLQKWSWGELAASSIQELAAAALADGARKPEIRRHLVDIERQGMKEGSNGGTLCLPESVIKLCQVKQR